MDAQAWRRAEHCPQILSEPVSRAEFVAVPWGGCSRRSYQWTPLLMDWTFFQAGSQRRRRLAGFDRPVSDSGLRALLFPAQFIPVVGPGEAALPPR